ncbi:cation-transporting P-type ATPase [Parahaliea maris]|uniref:Cation-transporting P-type ATPase n=1 Tax=Parahaliea maris TaxID=2716870 RepID=A0A5C9A379_9GAMM|nr:cation-transporting P-type ATPase [Parahaliea maris]TXS94230.1 cation-transporting P-type ATPase [Parahaliea maris]
MEQGTERGTAGLEEPAYRLSAEDVIARLDSDAMNGLAEAEAAERRARFGANLLEESGRQPLYQLFLHQFRDLLIVVLFVAAALAWYLGDIRGAIVLLVIILTNAAIGLYQEYHAEALLERLRLMIRSRARVVRGGETREVDAEDLVPGDIVLLDEGDAVAADLRLVETRELATNDFILTGESVPQDKDAAVVLEAESGLSEQDNLVFMGTTVARGSARGVVVATGMTSAIGEIARVGQTIQRDRSPLQREMNALAGLLTKMAAVIALGVFAFNLLLRGAEYADTAALVNASILFAIGVAAACVPQGLPAQITVALSLGVSRLARENAVVKRLSAVETLGCTSVICSDKTGTITENQMTIVRAWVPGISYDITGQGYDPEGAIQREGRALESQELGRAGFFFQHGLLASNGRTHEPDDSHPAWYALGDPTEAAFTPLAIKAGLDPDERSSAYPVVAELPFDSERKRMTLVRSHAGRTIGFMKGATGSVLETCTGCQLDGVVVPLDDTQRRAVEQQVAAYSADSLRVIALAYREFGEDEVEFSIEASEQDFVFAGLVAMLDPPREGVRRAVSEVLGAQVRLFMLTGDNPITAAAIAERIGMPEGRVLTGDELARMPDGELREVLSGESLIMSRVSPQDKYRVVKLLKSLGEVVAVTGDGVNDTLSLKSADIGVAMGEQGSDVAKEAAEIVLTDDDLTTLVLAVREGRTIYQNLRSVILSSITSNIGELSCVCIGFGGAAVGLPIPITAVQILSIDLMGEMLPLMALTFDPAEPRLMQQPPRKTGAHIIDRRRLLELVLFGTLMGLGGYFSFYMVLATGGSTAMAQAATFLGIVLVQYMNILSRRSAGSLFSRYLFSNRPLGLALLFSFLFVAIITTAPGVGSWFGFEPLRPRDWLWPALAALVFLGAMELRKALSR